MNKVFPLIGLLLILAVSGCDPQPSPPEEPEPPPTIVSDFDAAAAGSISGRVRWAGAVPAFPSIGGQVATAGGKTEQRQFPNPNALHVDAQTHLVEGAVVFLEGIDPRHARPWDHGEVRIEVDLAQIHVIQGASAPRQIGFVRAGDEIEMASRDEYLHILSARGTAFFALAFPDANRPLRRRIDHPGLVELGSGAARYWHRAYLWVADHPYFTLTDAAGRFVLAGVPAGEYRLVAWLPNGRIAAIDRDPNTGGILRYHFTEPLRVSKPVRVESRQTAAVDCFLMN